MGSEWRSTTLGQVVEEGGGFIQTGPFGSQLHASDYVAKGIPTIMPANMANNRVDITGIARITEEDAERLSKHIVQPDDIVYSRRGDVTLKALIRESDEKMICGTGCLLVRPGKGIDPKFLTYHLSSPQNQEWIIRHAIGATMPNLNQGILSNVPLHVPSISIQKAIAHILGTLDDKIELNRQMNATLEAMAQALFQSWFVDFNPVIDNALAAGHPIPDTLQERAAARAALGHRRQPLPAAIQSQFPSSFVRHEEMGWVPAGWAVDTLGTITTELRRGISPKYVDEGGVRVINQKCIRDHLVNYSLARRTDETKVKINGRELEVGDVLVNSTGEGTLGRVAQVLVLDETTVVDSHVTVVRSKTEIYKPYIFARMMLTLESQIAAMGEGSTGQTELSRANLQAISVVIPSIESQEWGEKYFYDIAQKVVHNSEENEKLITLRDTLLPKLLSGAVRVAAAG
jgi:type I restriction enzyme S subunit